MFDLLPGFDRYANFKKYQPHNNLNQVIKEIILF